ncbi:MAG: hypothetical protein NTX25_04355 [Proteobacteria bacterium]|nr:hypothetical protein [Pseudomonadota bacterium]
MKNKKLLVGVVGLALLVFFVFFKKQGEGVKVPEKVEQNQVVSIKPESAPTKVSIEQQRSAYFEKMQLGISSASLPIESGFAKASIKIKNRKLYCRGGEIDTMDRDAANASSKEFLLTVEAIGQSGKPYLQDSLSVNDLKAETLHNFSIPAHESNKLLGVYICHDTKKDKSCQNKKVLDYKTHGKNVGNALNKSDVIYIFHKLLLGKDGNISLFSSFVGDVKNDRSNKYISAQGKIDNNLIAEASAIDRKLRSEALQMSNKIIELTLTLGDRSCLNNASPTSPRIKK